MSRIEGPIATAEPTLTFDELAGIRALTSRIGGSAWISLQQYYDQESGGFFHLQADEAADGNKPGEFSKSSTATVVEFLVRSGHWSKDDDEDERDERQGLLDRVIAGQWTSAKLPLNNPFTVAFLLELVGSLVDCGATLSSAQAHTVEEKLKLLLGRLRSRGAVELKQRQVMSEGPNSFLTQLAVRVLRRWSTRENSEVNPPGIDAGLQERIAEAAYNSMFKELSLLTSAPKTSDVFELGYAVLLLEDLALPFKPWERSVVHSALEQLFESQTQDGSWPQSRKLFFYPKYGNAYCYEYEFLTQLLTTFSDGAVLRPYLSNLRAALHRLVREETVLNGGGWGWNSGHHPGLRYPESWSTASAFHFCHLLDRLVADAITDSIQRHLGAPTSTRPKEADRTKFDAILDSSIDGAHESLKSVMDSQVIAPISGQASALREGRPLAEQTPVSAILFGPPGTSKTTYASAIAEAIGWDLVTINPSHLLRQGIDGLPSEVASLFRMLNYVERTVVLFDEIEELVRRRADGVEITTRFLTTTMLPKISELRAQRRLFFIVATNHLETFDTAIARRGRFDLILPVMPPTTTAKLARRPDLASHLETLGLADDEEVREQLGTLTYGEFESVVDELLNATTADEATIALTGRYDSCTMNQRPHTASNETNQDATWADIVAAQSGSIRVHL